MQQENCSSPEENQDVIITKGVIDADQAKEEMSTTNSLIVLEIAKWLGNIRVDSTLCRTAIILHRIFPNTIYSQKCNAIKSGKKKNKKPFLINFGDIRGGLHLE